MVEMVGQPLEDLTTIRLLRREIKELMPDSSQDPSAEACRATRTACSTNLSALQSPTKLAEEPAISYWIFAVKIKQAAGTCRHMPA